MKQNIFFTLDSSLVVRQKQIFYAVIALFIFSEFAGILNYKNFENLLIFLDFGLVVLGIYISMDKSKLKVMHWLAACFSVFIWAILDAVRNVNEDFLLRNKEQISYLDLFALLPMFLFFIAVSILFINKIKRLDKSSRNQVLFDIFNVFLLVCAFVYCIIDNFDSFKCFICSKDINKTTSTIAFFINLLTLFVALSEFFTSNTLKLKYSGFYFICASAIFALLNLYIFYNKFLNNNFKFMFYSLYLIIFFILMLGSFYLKGNNKYLNIPFFNALPKYIPIISICMFLMKDNSEPVFDLLFLFLIVAFAILGYYFRASNHINEIRLAEERLLEMKTKEKNSKMVELEMINLSLETISEKDYLTSLDNRDSLLNKLKEMCEKLDNQKEIAVYYINISRFKNINTSYGHEIGDKILKFIAKRMRLICNKEEVVSRVGSDEFIILSKMDIGSHTKRMNFGMRLKDAIEDSLQIDKYHFSLRSVIGIYVVTNKNITEPRDIVKKADMAMYFAKQNPALNPAVYSEKMNSEIHKKSTIETALKKANFYEDFQVYFQPIIDFKNKKMICAEALLRWQSKEFGLKEASEFMPIASLNSDILDEICEFSVLKTIEQIVFWKSKRLKIPKISMNINYIQSTSEKFINNFLITLNSNHISPSQFEFEFSEDIWQNKQETLDKIFAILEKSNIDVCIDDFGSGYTSLIYVRKYKIKHIKISNDFVSNAISNKLDMQIVTAIISLAKSMKLRVTAKGVESHEIKELLKELNCDEMQGYYLCHPMSVSDFEDFIKQNPHMVADI